jgi:choline-sulfatase
MSERRPNILFIVADQLAAPFLRAYGHKLVKTPHIDKLAEAGVVFQNFYSPSPLCAPARATLMSGLLPSSTGVYDNAAEFPSAIPTFAHYLRLQGYQTCLSGKMHFVGPDQLHGFEERLTTDIYPADFGWTPDWSKPQARIDWWYHNMSSVKQAGIAEITNQLEYDDEVAFLAGRKLFDYARYGEGRPFCLTVSFTHPHDPYVARASFWNLYRDDEIDMPRTRAIAYDELDPHSRRLYDVAAVDDYEVSEADIRSSRHGYYASISYIDSLIGGLVETLKSCGLADNTIIALTSDHGDFLGERGLWYKMSFLEHSARVPLIICGERFFKPRRVGAPASLADIMPTFCDLAMEGKSSLARPVDGRSLYPLLQGAAENSTAAVFGEYLAEGALAPIYMLRRDKWKFIQSEPDPDQLYDLDSDPDELNNIAKDPQHQSLVSKLTALLGERFDPPESKRRVMESQKARHMLFAALKRGSYFPWDFQPLRDASEQYTRNHMDVTERDIQSRFPKAPEVPGQDRKAR